LTSAQLSEWEAYDRIDPIGSWRDDFRMAAIQSTLVNIHNACNTKEGDSPLKSSPSDFLPIWDEEERKKKAEPVLVQQTQEELKAALYSVFGVKNYIIKDGKRIRVPKQKTIK